MSLRSCVSSTPGAEPSCLMRSAPGVELTQDRKDILYDESELRSLEMPHLRSLMERYCMKPPTGDMDEVEERAVALDRFAEAGWMGKRKLSSLSDGAGAEAGPAADAGTTKEKPSPPAGSAGKELKSAADAGATGEAAPAGR